MLGAIEGQVYDGPWTDIEEDVEKINGMARWTGSSDGIDFGVTAMFYDATWNSADQIPQRAVDQGLIDPYGSLDKTLGGSTRRSSLSGSLGWSGDNYLGELNAWVIDYDFQLWSNFTYLLDQPDTGDQIEQRDSRQIWGGRVDGDEKRQALLDGVEEIARYTT